MRVCHSGSLPHINKDKIFFIGVPKRGRLESRGYAIGAYIIQEYLRTLSRMKYFSLGFHNGDVWSHGATLLAGFSFGNTYAQVLRHSTVPFLDASPVFSDANVATSRGFGHDIFTEATVDGPFNMTVLGTAHLKRTNPTFLFRCRGLNEYSRPQI